MVKPAKGSMGLGSLKRFKVTKRFRKLFKKRKKKVSLTKAEKDPNRTLSQIDYYTLFTFALTNPVIKSMRGLCAASQLESVQQATESNPVRRTSFSEAQHCYDHDILRKIIRDLSAQFQPSFGDSKLRQLIDELIAVDGTLIPALPRMTWALWQDESHRAAKLHLHYSVLTQSIVDAYITPANTCERAVLLNSIKEGVLYVADRYYGGDYRFFKYFDDTNSFFVIRIRNDAVIDELEPFEIPPEAQKAGVIWDGKVRLGEDNPKGPYRLVKIKAWNTTLNILTNKYDLPAELISLIYLYRWQIEILFKWIKCILECRHLYAESQEGVTVQIYLAIIISLILFLATGKKPTKRQMELIQFYMLGWVKDDEMLQGLDSEKSV